MHIGKPTQCYSSQRKVVTFTTILAPWTFFSRLLRETLASKKDTMKVCGIATFLVVLTKLEKESQYNYENEVLN